MRTGLWLIAALLVSAPLQAQTPIVIGPASVLEWSQPYASVALAQAATYALIVDAQAPMVLTGVTCVAGTATVQTCNVPAVGRAPLGTHTLTMTTTDGGGTSLPSAPYSYLTLLIPLPPTNIRIR